MADRLAMNVKRVPFIPSSSRDPIALEWQLQLGEQIVYRAVHELHVAPTGMPADRARKDTLV